MKHLRYLAALAAGLLAVSAFSGCRRVAAPEQTTARPAGEAEETVGGGAGTTQAAAGAETSALAQTSAGAQTSAPATAGSPETSAAASVPEQTAASAVPAAAESAAAETAEAPSVPAEETAAAVPSAPEPEVTLPIRLPEANGEMEATTDPGNPFIAAVSGERGLDPAKLWAVYAVPASGQNYVFEFYSADARGPEDLRRVYLLTDEAVIRSVAASSNEERENISVTENWFCMNVLIKGVIFPSVAQKLQK